MNKKQLHISKQNDNFLKKIPKARRVKTLMTYQAMKIRLTSDLVPPVFALIKNNKHFMQILKKNKFDFINAFPDTLFCFPQLE